ncbi:MAG: ferrochelatase [Steroidobacteraceae bacterium]
MARLIATAMPMPDFLGTSNFDHRTAERIGVLLVNLGTPAAPDTASVRRYLKQFLSDPRVIEYPRWLWWLVLNGVILRIRPRKSAHAYQQIWTPQGSPLMVNTQQLAGKLQTQLRETLHADVQLAVGMTYGEPSIAQALEQLRQANVRKLVVLPLYPQYSGSTTGSVFDVVSRVLQGWRWVPELRFIAQYHDHDAYLEALANSIRAHWNTQGQQHLLLSFHGLPKSYLAKGDPYFCHCHKTGRLLAERLNLTQDQWSLSFQSRVGREEWLRPYTDELLIKYAQQGPKRVTVACPGFAADCLETLEEIAMRNREDFLRAGGEHFDYVPALNADDQHVQALAQLIQQHTQSWLPLDNHEQAQQLAMQQGAPQ